MRYKSFPDGKRQVLNFALPGDLLGLQSSLFNHMTHSVEALTDVTLCVFPRQRIWELYKDHPGLAFDVTWLASREESILADHLANVGQRPAMVRVAYMLIYLFNRARRLGLVRCNKMLLPITQQDPGGRDGPFDRAYQQDVEAFTGDRLVRLAAPRVRVERRGQTDRTGRIRLRRATAAPLHLGNQTTHREQISKVGVCVADGNRP